MKKILTLALVFVLILGTSSFALAMDYADMTYNLSDQKPYYRGEIYGVNEHLGYSFGYYQNSEMLLMVSQSIGLNSVGVRKTLYATGRYLFDSGIFVLVESQNEISDTIDGVQDYSYAIAPGYRFNFDEKSYIAGYVDYSKYNYMEEPVFGFCIYGKHLSETMKITGEVYSFFKNIAGQVRFNYLLTEGLVAGGELRATWYESQDSIFNFSEGCSYSTDRFAANLTLSGDLENLIGSYSINAIYYLTDGLGFGVTCSDSIGVDGGTPNITYMGKYRMDDAYFVLTYTPSDSFNRWSISYRKTL